MKKQTLPGISDIEVVGDAAEQPEPSGASIDFSKMENSFHLSRIDVSELVSANDEHIDGDEERARLAKTGITIEAFTPDEEEKFGLKDHPLHKEHLSQTK